MNLEQFIKSIRENFHRLPNVDATMSYLRYHLELLEWKKQKLKLGAIVFEIKETLYHGIVLTEEVDIRFIRQDTTEADNLKLENRLKAIGWKWDMKNYAALGVVILGFICELYTHVNYWYRKNLPTLAYRSEHFDYILRCGFESSFSLGQVGIFKKYLIYNYWLIDLFTDFSIYFNIIF